MFHWTRIIFKNCQSLWFSSIWTIFMNMNLMKMLMMKTMIGSVCVVLCSRCALYLEPMWQRCGNFQCSMWQRCGNFLTIDLKNLSISRRSKSFSYITFLTRFSSLLSQKAFKFFWVLPNVLQKKTKSMFQKGRIYQRSNRAPCIASGYEK